MVYDTPRVTDDETNPSTMNDIALLMSCVEVDSI